MQRVGWIQVGLNGDGTSLNTRQAIDRFCWICLDSIVSLDKDLFRPQKMKDRVVSSNLFNQKSYVRVWQTQ